VWGVERRRCGGEGGLRVVERRGGWGGGGLGEGRSPSVPSL
jgi:hypothetical protein